MSSYKGHTPAPWAVQPDEVTVYQSPAVYEHRAVIAKASPVFMNRAERKANARLIAAAPDLLAERNRMQHALWMLANCKFGGIRAKQRMQEIAREALQEAEDEV